MIPLKAIETRRQPIIRMGQGSLQTKKKSGLLKVDPLKEFQGAHGRARRKARSTAER